MDAEPAYDDAALYGKDPTPGILDVVAVRDAPDSAPATVRLYRRAPDGLLVAEDDRVYPFFFLSDDTLLDGLAKTYKLQRLDGDAFFRFVVVFNTWRHYYDALRHLDTATESRERRPDEVYRVGSPAQQYLMQTGRTLFKGMTLEDLHRLQFDLEVVSEGGFPSADRPNDAVVIVALSDNRGWSLLLHSNDHGDEARLLREALDAIRERDPDVLEGHNCLLPGTAIWTPDQGPVCVQEAQRVRHVFGTSGAQACTGVRARPYRGEAVALHVDRGFTLATTADHPHLVARTAGTQWLPAEQVAEGDYVAAPRRLDVAVVDDELSDDDYYAAGLIWSDGHIPRGTNVLWFSNTSPALLDWMRAYWGEAAFEKSPVQRAPQHAPLIRVCLTSPEMRARMHALGVPEGNKLDVPVTFRRVVFAPDRKALAFLQGVLDGDGSVRPGHAHIATASRSFRHVLAFLCRRFGWQTSENNSGVLVYPTRDSVDRYDALVLGLRSPHKRIPYDRSRAFRDDVPAEVVQRIKPFFRTTGESARTSWKPGFADVDLPRSTVNYILNGRTRLRRDLAYRLIEVVDAHVQAAPSEDYAAWEQAKGFVLGLLQLAWMRVRRVTRSTYDGPVYNTTTPDGTYVANGLLTHNCYAFDLPYFETRCRRHGIPFEIGRDGSTPRSFPAQIRFAERSIEYPAYEIAGRHVVDTLFQVMSYDVTKRDLPGYGLKVVAKYFGFAPEGRTYVDGDRIGETWRTDPDRLLAYALDDVIETERIARHLSGASFYLTQMLPMPYGQAARTGPAAKIEALFVREYLRQRRSVPKPEWGSQTVGGYTDVFATGVFGPIVYADVESLYPSIMLEFDVRPRSDTLGLFPALLRRLRDLRIETKRAARTADTPDERSSLDARQSSYKILINSFYGYLAFGFGSFNDFAEADRVAATGQELLRAVIRVLVERGATVVEVDTDGVLFVPPPGLPHTAEAEEAFVATLNDVLPSGIRIAYEGRAAKMLSYKKKNYALVEDDGTIKFKGSSLVSRSIERFGRAFVADAIRLLLDEDVDGLHRLYVTTRERILARDWQGVERFARTETLKDPVERYQADVAEGKRTRAASYELAIRQAEETGLPVKVGDRVTYYVTGTTASVTTFENARLARFWTADAPDENTAYYVKRLDEFARKFDVFFTPEDFARVFAPPDLFGFDASAIRLVRHVQDPGAAVDEVPF